MHRAFLTLLAATALAAQEAPPLAQWLAAPSLADSLALAAAHPEGSAPNTLQLLINGARGAGVEGRPEESRRAYELVAALAEKSGQDRYRALAKWGLANLATDPALALAQLRDALPYFEGRGEEARTGALLSSMGFHLVRAHRLAEATAVLERAIPLIARDREPGREAPRRDALVSAYGTLGTIWMMQSRWDRAAAELERALDLAGNSPVRTNLLSNLADVRWEQGDSSAAHDLLEQALRAAQADDNHIETTVALRRLGQFALARGDLAEGETHLRASLVAAARLKDAWRQSILLELLAEVRLRRGDGAEAKSLAEKSIELAKASGNRFSIWHADLVLARVARATGDGPGAEARLREAISELEAVRSAQAGERAEGWAFLSGRTAVWWELGDLLAARGEVASALAVSGQARAHVLRELAGEVGPAPSLDAPSAAPAEGELQLEFLAGEEGFLLFARNAQDPPCVHRLALTPRALERQAGQFRERLGQRSIAWRDEAKVLRKALLGPVETMLAGARRVSISPDGAAWTVPFAALAAADGKLLAETHALRLAPTFRPRPARPAPDGSAFLIFAHPELPPAAQRAGLAPLPGSEAPARRLAESEGGRAALHLRGEARESVFRQAAPTAGVLHFATHGVLNDRSPLHSHLVLAAPLADEPDDGLLEAREVLQMKLQARVAVLGSCQSGRGRIGGGEGLVGLSWAFLAAGCGSTVVSLWEVDASATGELLEHFHTALRAGAEPAEALREAGTRLRTKAEYRHPFFWTPFVVVGW